LTTGEALNESKAGELDMLFIEGVFCYIVTLVKIDPVFKQDIINRYTTDTKLLRIVSTLQDNKKLGKEIVELPFKQT
jgi:hypothetical protein